MHKPFRLRTAFTGALVILSLSCGFAQDTTKSREETTGTAQATAVLVGEPLKWFSDSRTIASEAVDKKISDLLGMKIVNLTKPDQKLKDTIGKTSDVLALKPELVVVLTGLSDEKAGSTEEELKEQVTKLVRGLSKVDLYVVPSSSEVGAATNAVLRISSTQAGAQYVDPGAEMTGEPYKDTFTEMRRLHAATMNRPSGVPAVVQIATPVSAPVTTEGGQRVVKAGPAETPVTIEMQPPKPLKRFNAEKPGAARKTTKKQPAVAP